TRRRGPAPAPAHSPVVPARDDEHRTLRAVEELLHDRPCDHPMQAAGTSVDMSRHDHHADAITYRDLGKGFARIAVRNLVRPRHGAVGQLAVDLGAYGGETLFGLRFPVELVRIEREIVQIG